MLSLNKHFSLLVLLKSEVLLNDSFISSCSCTTGGPIKVFVEGSTSFQLHRLQKYEQPVLDVIGLPRALSDY